MVYAIFVSVENGICCWRGRIRCAGIVGNCPILANESFMGHSD
jgi:hypothetical protein